MIYKKYFFILVVSAAVLFNFLSCSKFRLKDVQFMVRADIGKYLFSISRDPDSTLASILNNVSSKINYDKDDYIDLLNKELDSNKIFARKYFGSLISSMVMDAYGEDIKITKGLKDSIDRLVKSDIEVVKKRVETFGVKNYNVSQEGKYDIKITASTEGNIDELNLLLLIKGNLEFKLEFEQTDAMNVMMRIDSVLSGNARLQYRIVDEQDTSHFKELHPWFYLVNFYEYQEGSITFTSKESVKEDVENILMRQEIKNVIPENVCLSWDHNAGIVGKNKENIYKIYVLKKQPELTGSVITHTVCEIDEATNAPIVAIEMNKEGADRWAKITEENVNKRVAIVLDDKVVSCPIIRSKITGGKTEIALLSSWSEANEIAVAIKAGVLPMPLVLVSQH